jgi:hypothetical protein
VKPYGVLGEALLPPAGVHSTAAPSTSGNDTLFTPVPASAALNFTVTLPVCAGLKYSGCAVLPSQYWYDVPLTGRKLLKLIVGGVLSTTIVRVIGAAFVLPALSVTVSVMVYVPSGTTVVSQLQFHEVGEAGAWQSAPLAGPE